MGWSTTYIEEVGRITQHISHVEVCLHLPTRALPPPLTPHPPPPVNDDTLLAPGHTRRCVVPAHPDVVAIHATRSKDAVPYLSEIVHQATKMTTNTEDTSTSTRDDATRVRFVLAVTQTAPKETLSGNKRSISAPEEQAGGGAASDLAGFSIVQGRPDESMLKREVPDVAERQVMLCGPDAFMVGMDGLLRGLGVASSRIHSEEFYF